MCFCARGCVQFTAYGGELMRDAIRNDDHLAFTYLVFLASVVLAPLISLGAISFGS
jgi:hypothetical protein